MGRLHASERLTRIAPGSWMDATPPLVSLVEGRGTRATTQQDGGAEDKLRGVSVRHSCAFNGDLISAQGTRRKKGGWAIDAGPSMNEASGQRI